VGKEHGQCGQTAKSIQRAIFEASVAPDRSARCGEDGAWCRHEIVAWPWTARLRKQDSVRRRKRVPLPCGRHEAGLKP